MRSDKVYIENIESGIYSKLQKHLNRLPIGFPATKSGVELKILQSLFTPEEALIALKMRYIPEPIKNIFRRAKKYGITKEQLKMKLDQMFKKGSIRRVKRTIDDQKVFFYQISPLVVGMFEYQVNRLTKDFYKDFEQYMDEAFRKEFTSTKINQLRTIPIGTSLTPNHNIATYDDLKKVFTHANNIAVSPCICHQAKQLKETSCRGIEERCFTINDSAFNAVERGYGRFVNEKEAYEIIDKAQKQGMVIQPTNSKFPSYVCCCCDCCDLISNLKKLEHPWELITSNYYAILNSNLCVGCGSCVDICKMDAISLNEVATIEKLYCIGCGNCIVQCPENAIKLQFKEKEIDVPESTQDLFLKILNKKAALRRKKKGIE